MWGQEGGRWGAEGGAVRRVCSAVGTACRCPIQDTHHQHLPMAAETWQIDEGSRDGEATLVCQGDPGEPQVLYKSQRKAAVSGWKVPHCTSQGMRDF